MYSAESGTEAQEKSSEWHKAGEGGLEQIAKGTSVAPISEWLI